MADFTQTINETIRSFGPGPSTKWGTAPNDVYVMTWGSDKWGFGSEDTTQDVGKVLDETQASADAILQLQATKILSESQPSSDDMDHAYLTLGGYYHEFISQVIDADDQTVNSYTAGSNPSSTYAQTSNPSTVWT